MRNKKGWRVMIGYRWSSRLDEFYVAALHFDKAGRLALAAAKRSSVNDGAHVVSVERLAGRVLG